MGSTILYAFQTDVLPGDIVARLPPSTQLESLCLPRLGRPLKCDDDLEE